jgi:hypothetical protein
MSKIMLGACIALLALSPPALAQGFRHKPAPSVKSETLDTSMARLAVKAAFHPAAQPTRQELLGVILLMSLREQRGSGT